MTGAFVRHRIAPLAPTRVARVAALVGEGLGDSAIAHRMGLSLAAAIACREAAGLPANTHRITLKRFSWEDTP